MFRRAEIQNICSYLQNNIFFVKYFQKYKSIHFYFLYTLVIYIYILLAKRNAPILFRYHINTQLPTHTS